MQVRVVPFQTGFTQILVFLVLFIMKMNNVHNDLNFDSLTYDLHPVGAILRLR